MPKTSDPGPLSLGIDIGGTKAHGVVLDAADRVLAQHLLPTEPTGQGVRRTVLAVASGLAGALGIGLGELARLEAEPREVRAAARAAEPREGDGS